MTVKQAKVEADALAGLLSRQKSETAELDTKDTEMLAKLNRLLRARRLNLELCQAREYFRLRMKFGHRLGAGARAVLECPRHGHT
jgi:hypothetical protein